MRVDAIQTFLLRLSSSSLRLQWASVPGLPKIVNGSQSHINKSLIENQGNCFLLPSVPFHIMIVTAKNQGLHKTWQDQQETRKKMRIIIWALKVEGKGLGLLAFPSIQSFLFSSYEEHTVEKESSSSLLPKAETAELQKYTALEKISCT